MSILQEKLPPNMKSQFWIDFINAIEEESFLVKEKIREKKNLYVIDEMSYQRLMDLADVIDIPFDASVNESIEFLREEVRAIPFRIKWKATIRLYLSYLKALERSGAIYLYFKEDSVLLRHSENILRTINGIDPSKGILHLSKNNFTGSVNKQIKLDTGYKLDATEGVWALDSLTAKQPTKHLALEILIDRSYYGISGLAPAEDLTPSIYLAPAGKELTLIAPDYLNYLSNSINISKKMTEVAHIGCQLTIVVDDSRIWDQLDLAFTMPAMNLKAITTDFMTTISSVSDIDSIELGISDVGIDLPLLPSKAGEIEEVVPTALTHKICKLRIHDLEKWEEPDWYGVCATYTGTLINDVVIGTGNGVSTHFTKVLDDIPVKPAFSKITFTANSIVRELKDDGYGTFVGPDGTGTIDYATGAITLDTDAYHNRIQVIGTGNGIQDDFTYTVSSEYTPIQESSIKITYVLAGTTYLATDNGVGVITGESCTGTVNYISGEVILAFTTPPVATTSLTMDFNYTKIVIPDDGDPIYIEYYFGGNSWYDFHIVEACAKNETGDIIAYAQFPPMIFSELHHHLSIGFIIKKSNFDPIV